MKLDLYLLERLLQKGNATLTWAHGSVWRRLLIWCIAITITLGTPIIGTEWLMSQRRDETGQRLAEVTLKSRELTLRAAADRIADCIAALQVPLPEQAWYCEGAIQAYRRASQVYTVPEHVEEVIQKQLFFAMRTEVALYIRALDLEREPRPRSWDLANQLLFAPSWKGPAIWLVAAAAFLGFMSFRLWLPQRRKLVIRKVSRSGTPRRSL